MIGKKQLALLVCIALGFTLYAQESTSGGELKQDVKKYKKVSIGKKLKIAKKLEQEGSYINAVRYYDDVYLANPKKKDVVKRLADMNFLLRDYQKSEKFYKELIDLDADNFPALYMMYGKSLKANGKYEEAAKAFKTAKDKLTDEKSTKILNNEIAGCDLALAQNANAPVKIKVEHVESNVNAKLQEFAPKPTSDGILFSSLRSDTAIDLSKYWKDNKDYHAKIYTAKNVQGVWSNPEALPASVNTAKAHAGNATLTDNGKTLFYTQCTEGTKLQMSCKIYKSTLENDGWGRGEEVAALNQLGTTNTQPTIQDLEEGKKRIYFVSDRANGKGGTDIYYAEISKEGSVGAPKNAGEINTFGDEVTPYFSAKEKKLFFSTDGRPSLGGLDVYEVTGEPDAWGEVKHLDAPVNSSYDDQYVALDDRLKGYMVSNRPGSISPRGVSCCDDIWTVDYMRDLYLKGIFVSSNDADKRAVEGVNVSFYNKKGEQVNTLVTKASEPFILKLEPGMTYKVNGMKEGYFPSVETVVAPSELKQTDTLVKYFLIDPINKKRYIIENVYFAFNKSDIRQQYEYALDSVLVILNENPDFFLKVDGHTDSKGSGEYNQKLSERRAASAGQYLTKKGIVDDRLILKGYGEKKPIAPNENADGTDNPEGRAKNRRVEFKIMSEVGKDKGIQIDYPDTNPKSTD